MKIKHRTLKELRLVGTFFECRTGLQLIVDGVQLLKKGDVASTFVGDLKDVCRRFEDFKCHCGDNSKGAYLTFQSSICEFEAR